MFPLWWGPSAHSGHPFFHPIFPGTAERTMHILDCSDAGRAVPGRIPASFAHPITVVNSRSPSLIPAHNSWCPEQCFRVSENTPEESDGFETPLQTRRKWGIPGRNNRSFLLLFSLSGTYERPACNTFCSKVDIQAGIAPGITPTVKRVIFPHRAIPTGNVDGRNVWPPREASLLVYSGVWAERSTNGTKTEQKDKKHTFLHLPQPRHRAA